jgi:predicted MPP superfamily phosphohydrolase
MKRVIVLMLSIFLILCLEYYLSQGIQEFADAYNPNIRVAIGTLYWVLTGVTLGSFLISGLSKMGFQTRFFKQLFIPVFLIQYTSKLFLASFLLLADIFRFLKWFFIKLTTMSATDAVYDTVIKRSECLRDTGVMVAALPLVTMTYGILAGAHDYRIRRVKVKLPNLPTSFHGLKIGQLSDIHSGSFFNRSAVKQGIAMFLAEKPDLIFFTGDLVNDRAEEVKEYMDIFSQIKAPLGVFSTLGNHDYGDYIIWPSLQAKQQNLVNMCKVHELLGWKLLMNTHKILNHGNDQIAIIGVENWGMGRFGKYGQLAKAYQGTEEVPVKLLLSHDPSHWDAEVRPLFPAIDITFSGHTHGCQFGIEIGSFKWSPVQYLYKQWAGLYQAGKQYLYVNRGFGYIGYPGRIGIWPELTMLELEKA